MNRILSYLSTAIIILLLPVQSAYMQGYKIEASISGLQDTSLILSYRYGTKFYSIDTTTVDNKGIAVFQDTTKLERGMYQIILPDRSFIDIFIDDSREITIETKIESLIKSLSSPNSNINNEFFQWQSQNQDLRKRAQDLQNKLNATQASNPEYGALQKELGTLRDENKKLWDDAISNLGESLPGKFLNGMRPLEIPGNITDNAPEEQHQLIRYEYYKQHFFDQVDFSDAGLIRTPLINNKLEHFFSKIVPGIPDSVIIYADEVISRSESSPEMFQFAIQFLLNYYSEPKLMGMDAVYVHIAEKYYLSGRANWLDEHNLTLIENRVKVLKPLLIGKVAPKLPGMETPEGEAINILDIEAKFIMLYFWEPDCSFCKTATPMLMDIYKKYKNQGIEAVAVNTRTEKEPWEQFIAEHELTWLNIYSPINVREVLNLYEAYSTPKLFILDQDKKIVAKDIGIDQASGVLDHLLSKK